MVKLTLSVFIAALLAAPALASYSDFEARAVYDDDLDLVTRELGEDEANFFSRDLQELYSRGLSQDNIDELVSREPRIKLNFIKNLLFRRSDESETFAREYDGLDAREFDDLD